LNGEIERATASVARYLQGRGLPALVADYYVRRAASPNQIVNAIDDLPVPFSELSGPARRLLASDVMVEVDPLVRSAILIPFLLISLLQIARRTINELAMSSIIGVSEDLRAALPSMPPLLAVLLLLIVTGDAWRALANLSGLRLELVLFTFLVASFTFLWIGCQTYRQRLFGARNLEAVRTLASRTPAIALVRANIAPSFARLPFVLRLNVWAVVVSGLAARIVGLGLWIGLAFLAIGIVVLDEPTVRHLLGSEPHVVISRLIGGVSFTLTWELVTLCLVFGSLSALYFTALGLQNRRVPAAFTRDMFSKLEEALAAFDYYRGAVGNAAIPWPWLRTTNASEYPRKRGEV
jgi:hypothetical protein